jgi:sensor c-di-GMP phosphodiesterase-like protein
VAHAIRERSFEIYYQPIYSLKDECFYSAEALARLTDPEYGPIPPAVFISDAEQSGAILQIESILLDKIFCFLGSVDYEATGLSYVEINLSTEQCMRPQMARELLGMMEGYGVSPRHVNLEMTETSAAFSQNIIEGNIRTLIGAGTSFSLDDFGSGYSNIVRMLDLPFDIVKYDKSFADDLWQHDTHIVLADTIPMLQSLGKKVLVEGVETAEQAEELRRLGVDYIQGYYYARPMPQDQFVAFMTEKNAS